MRSLPLSYTEEIQWWTDEGLWGYYNAKDGSLGTPRTAVKDGKKAEIGLVVNCKKLLVKRRLSIYPRWFDSAFLRKYVNINDEHRT